MKKQIPEFRSEDSEREFWAQHDSTGFIDWQPAQRQKLTKLKPALRTISLRLPDDRGSKNTCQQARRTVSVPFESISRRASRSGASPGVLIPPSTYPQAAIAFHLAVWAGNPVDNVQ